MSGRLVDLSILSIRVSTTICEMELFVYGMQRMSFPSSSLKLNDDARFPLFNLLCLEMTLTFSHI